MPPLSCYSGNLHNYYNITKTLKAKKLPLLQTIHLSIYKYCYIPASPLVLFYKAYKQNIEQVKLVLKKLLWQSNNNLEIAQLKIYNNK